MLTFMQELSSRDQERIGRKFMEFMQYTQRLSPGDSYLVVNRSAPQLSEISVGAAKEYGLNVELYDITSDTPFSPRFPETLVERLKHDTPRGAMGLFDYSSHPEWNLAERPARIHLLHCVIGEVPISWAHAPGIDIDMALNGALQCDYKYMAEKAQRMLQLLGGVKTLHVTSPSGTNVEITIPEVVRFTTDCILTPPDVYGKIGRFGNIPVGEVWADRRISIPSLDKEGRPVLQEYPVQLMANGIMRCDVCVGGHNGRLRAEQQLWVSFSNGIVERYGTSDEALQKIFKEWENSVHLYGLPIVLEEVGIGFNPAARPTGNMLESEKMGETMHLAPGGIGVHEDMLFSEPTVHAYYCDGTDKEIMRAGKIV